MAYKNSLLCFYNNNAFLALPYTISDVRDVGSNVFSTTYLLSIYTTVVSFYCDELVACNVKAGTLNLFHVFCVLVCRDDLLNLCRLYVISR